MVSSSAPSAQISLHGDTILQQVLGNDNNNTFSICILLPMSLEQLWFFSLPDFAEMHKAKV